MPPDQSPPHGPDISQLKPGHLPFPVVGIGGSAGAFPALLRFFQALPGDVHMAFVVVLHLSPNHESNAAEILQRATPLKVTQVVRRTAIEAGHVYVIPPAAQLFTDDGHLQPTAHNGRRPTAAIDNFFRTLAEVHGEQAVAIVMSGTGSDGMVGLTRVKELGGITLAQAPQDAEHAEMPRAAISSGMVDIVLPAADIGARLLDLGKSARQIRLPVADAPAETSADIEGQGIGLSGEQALQEIIALLRSHTRHDFRHYKRATVLRRIARRMQINGLPDLPSYRDFLRNNVNEVGPLLQDMLISVTSFFRDREAFDALERHVIAPICEGATTGEDVRVWVAGCATGEESYSISMLLREHLDRKTQPSGVQVFATDINETALAVGRRALYSSAIAADVTPTRLANFFAKEGDQFRISNTVREQVLFAKHNLLADPPFSRLDLICCRNVLIYLDRSAQASALEMFRYALKPGGFLFLGGSESADAAGNLFVPVDKDFRIFRVNAGAPAGGQARAFSNYISDRVPLPPVIAERSPRSQQEPLAAVLHQRTLMRVSPPSVLIDADHEVLHLSPGAGQYMGRGGGVPSHNLLNNVSPDIRLELRTALFKAQDSGTAAHTQVVREQPDGTNVNLKIAVYPTHQSDQEARRWLVVFDESVEATLAEGPNDPADTTHRLMIGKLEEENKELKAHLQDTLDRSAVSTEELKASNEELQAINEELRSATEELETSKEELQSMNEELTTVNYELRMKVEESGRINDDLRNLMSSSEIATVFVDSSLHIKRFTPQASKLFNLIASDVGRPLLDIRNRLNYDEMADDAASVFKDLHVIERRVTSTDNQQFFARILPYRTAGDKIEGAVLTFFNVTELHLAEERTRSAEERLRTAVAMSHDFAVVTMDADAIVTSWNTGAEALFGYASEEIIGRSINELYTPEDRALGVPEAERRTATMTGRCEDDRWHQRKDGSLFFCNGVLTKLVGDGNMAFAKIARDATGAKRTEREQEDLLRREKALNQEAQVASELKDRFLAMMSHELKQPLNLIQVNAELLTHLPETRVIPAAVRIGETIQRAVGTQSQIVNDLLDLSRVRTGKLRLNYGTVDLTRVVRALTRAIAAHAEASGVTVTLQSDESVVASCDRVRVEQIIWNLLGNAVKFTPAGQTISVGLMAEDEYAKIVVKDTGTGIATEFLPNMFAMFSQGPSMASGNNGLGIGLALVDELSRAHGGRVEAASDGPGKGATFTVWLPLARSDLPARDGPPPAMSLAGWSVLTVDDDVESQAAFAVLLRLDGAVVDTVGTAQAALEMLKSKRYDLLISDLSMPKMDGLALISEVRQLSTQAKLRAVAVSGYGREVDVRRALKAGFDAHVAKPASLAQLKAALAAL